MTEQVSPYALFKSGLDRREMRAVWRLRRRQAIARNRPKLVPYAGQEAWGEWA